MLKTRVSDENPGFGEKDGLLKTRVFGEKDGLFENPGFGEKDGLFENPGFGEKDGLFENPSFFEDQLMDNQAVTVQNRKNEAKLHQRVHRLEEEIKFLKMKQENGDKRLEFYKEHCAVLSMKYNEMVTTINTVIIELNHIISVVNNNNKD